MSYYDNGFARAQQLYDHQEPPDQDMPECPFCEDGGEFIQLEPGMWGCTCGAIFYAEMVDEPDHVVLVYEDKFAQLIRIDPFGAGHYQTMKDPHYPFKAGESVLFQELDEGVSRTGREARFQITEVTVMEMPFGKVVEIGLSPELRW